MQKGIADDQDKGSEEPIRAGSPQEPVLNVASQPSTAQRYGRTLIVLGLATAVRFALFGVLGGRLPFVFFFPCVLYGAWYGGVGPGLLTALMSAAIGTMFMASDPTWSAHPLDNGIGVAAFLVSSGLILMVAQAQHRSQRVAESKTALAHQRLEALSESEQRWLTTLTSIGDAVIATDATGRVTFMNNVAERLTGWSQAEAKGRPSSEVFQILNEETREVVVSPVDRVLSEGVVVGLANHTVVVTRDGKEYPIEDSGAPIKDEAGNLTGVVLVFHDVTEARRKEQAVQKSQERVRLIVDTALDAVIEIGEDDRILAWNAQAERMFGWFKEEAVGRLLVETIIPPAHREAHLQGMKRYLESGEGPVLNTRIEITALRRSGQQSFQDSFQYSFLEFPVELAITPIKTPDGTTFSAFIRDLTEQKQAEEQRRSLEVRFRMLVEQSPLSIQTLAPDGTTVQVNRAWEQLWGVTLEDIRGYNMLEDAQLVEKGVMPFIKRAFAGEAVEIPPIPYDVDRTLPDRESRDEHDEHDENDKAERWTRAVMYPVKDALGNIREVVLIHEDVGKQRLADQQRAHLAAIIESCDDAIVSKDLNGIVTSWNRAAERIYGYAPGEIVGKSKGLLLPEDRAGELQSILRKIRSGEAVDPYDTVRLRKDGTLVNVSVSVSPVRNADGDVIGASTIARDITERIRAEEQRVRLMVELANQRRRLDDLIGSVPGVVWEAWGKPDEENQRIDFVSEHVEEMLGYTPKEWVTTPNFWLSIVHPDDRERAAQVAAEAWSGGTHQPNEFRWIRKDGKAIWCEAHSVVVRDEDGAPLGMRGVTIDVSERKQAEVERAKHLAEIEVLNEQLKRAMSETHHRVKNNLQIITALIDMQANEPGLSIAAEEFLRIGGHVSALAAVHDLLTEQAKQDSTATDVSAREVLTRLVDLVRKSTGGQAVVADVEDTRLSARQATSLAIVAHELMTNALKYGRGVIELRFIVEDGSANLEVSDDGPGFHAAFDPTDSANTGLELVVQVAKWDLGSDDLRFDTRPGGGGRVSIRIPLTVEGPSA